MGRHPIIYILLNGELNMSPGKAAAQAVHAAMMLRNSVNTFANTYKRTVVVLEAKNSEQIRSLAEYCQGARLDAEYYIDEGVNEVDAYSVTAMAIAPLEIDDEEKRAIFEAFPLYPYDEYAEDGESSPPNELLYEFRQLRTVIQQSMLPEPKKIRWYKRLGRKKGYVS